MGPPRSIGLHIPSIHTDKKGKLSHSARWPDHDLNGMSVATERVVSRSVATGGEALSTSHALGSPSVALHSEVPSRLYAWKLPKILSELQAFQKKLLKELHSMSWSLQHVYWGEWSSFCHWYHVPSSLSSLVAAPLIKGRLNLILVGNSLQHLPLRL